MCVLCVCCVYMCVCAVCVEGVCGENVGWVYEMCLYDLYLGSLILTMNTGWGSDIACKLVWWVVFSYIVVHLHFVVGNRC